MGRRLTVEPVGPLLRADGLGCVVKRALGALAIGAAVIVPACIIDPEGYRVELD